MLKITKQKDNVLYYTCDCGASGMCSIKPINKDAAIVIVVKCPECEETEKVTLLQYSSEETKDRLVKELNNLDLLWRPTHTEEV